MKKINIIGILLLSFVIIFSSCEEETRPYSNLEGKTLSNGVVRIGFLNQTIKMVAEADDGSKPDYTTQMYVTLFGPPATSDITVNFEIDTATSTAKLGTHFTLSANQFVIKKGTNSGSIDITLINSALELDSLTPFNYHLTSAGDYKIDSLAKKTTVYLYKNCALDLDKFNGDFDLSIDGSLSSTVKVETDPDATNGIIISGPIWYSTSDTLKLAINPDDGTVTGEDYFIYNGNAYGSYGRIRFEDINGGMVTNNCTPDFEFKATPTLPDSGFWWGGEFTFSLTKVGKKVSEQPSPLIRKPFER